MSRMRQMKTTFTAGEVTRELLGRSDLRAYENGALKLRNVFIQPTGGVERRSGMRYVDDAYGAGRLISFEFNTEQTYLLVLTDGRVDIYADDVHQIGLNAPWRLADIHNIAWTQSADTLLLVHPELAPMRLTRNANGVWHLAEWEFIAIGNHVYQPYFKFAPAAVTITPSALTGNITVTTSAPCFSMAHVGAYLRIGGRTVRITDFYSSTVLGVDVSDELLTLTPTIDWDEQAFSKARGYPVSVAFHQDRLVLGGSRDLPHRLWFSKSGDLFNFDLGEGLDDNAIEFSILSDQVNAIRGMFSGRHLQIFTSGAEWMVTGDPLTPANVQIRRQTRIGSMVARYIPPVNVDGATLFVSRSGTQIQEFLYTDIEQAYQVTDLALVSRHIVPTPVDQDFDPQRRLLVIVREDGRIATLTVFRSESVAAWTLHETQGHVISVSVVGENVYFLIKRGDKFMIETWDDTINMDSALVGEANIASSQWSGLSHLEGCHVYIIADGIIHAPQVVTGGAIRLNNPAKSVEVGLSYTHIIEPLPPNALGDAGHAKATRLIEAVFRIEKTSALRLDVGRGLRDIALRRMGRNHLLDQAAPVISGDVRVRAYGWHTNLDQPLWRIEQSEPLPFKLLSVSTELKINQ
jgi:hypothetical protein